MIEESVFRRVGGVKDIGVDLRIIAATNLNIPEQVRKGNFREDLYYRLNVIPVEIPPLRRRGRDILLLADYFVHKYARELRRQVKGLAPETEATFLRGPWPGNVRELKNLIEREVLFSTTPWLSPADHLPAGMAEGLPGPAAERLCTLAEMERCHIRRVLEATGGNKTRAAQVLGISRTTLRDKIS
jgi:two-component system response regulator HydG